MTFVALALLALSAAPPRKSPADDPAVKALGMEPYYRAGIKYGALIAPKPDVGAQWALWERCGLLPNDILLKVGDHPMPSKLAIGAVKEACEKGEPALELERWGQLVVLEGKLPRKSVPPTALAKVVLDRHAEGTVLEKADLDGAPALRAAKLSSLLDACGLREGDFVLSVASETKSAAPTLESVVKACVTRADILVKRGPVKLQVRPGKDQFR